jgi:hypothetical protein
VVPSPGGPGDRTNPDVSGGPEGFQVNPSENKPANEEPPVKPGPNEFRGDRKNPHRGTNLPVHPVDHPDVVPAELAKRKLHRAVPPADQLGVQVGFPPTDHVEQGVTVAEDHRSPMDPVVRVGQP